MSTPIPGTCRYCGCQGEACTLPDGEKCAWRDADRLCCTAPGCMRAEMTRLSVVSYERARSKYAGWGYGAILEDLRKQRRGRRRRRKAA